MDHTSAFKTPEGEAAYLAAYDAAMQLWTVPYEEIEIPSRFGTTHVVVTGPKDAQPMVLLHGYMATLTMWSPNIADFNKGYRVYAVDVMGQPNMSIPNEPIRSATDFVEWLGVTLIGLDLDRISLVGMSHGAWLALNFAMASPERVQKLALLSPFACFLPMGKQFMVRGLLMSIIPTRGTVNSFARWLGTEYDPDNTLDRCALDLMYLGLKHFRIPPETARIMPSVFSDEELQALQVPVLLLMGDGEALYNPAKALTRARRLIPDFEGELVRGCSHEMTSSQYQIVDARVLDFLNDS